MASDTSRPTHYTVLALTPSMLHDTRDTSTLLKRAYRKALLLHHPDKSTPSSTRAMYSIDQISSAFAVLSSPGKRAEYDASLRQAAPTAVFHTGVENVDLDDVAFDEDEEQWYRACRCGNGRAYLFAEHHLEEASEEGVLMVACQDCSLWLRVHFAVIQDPSDIGPNDMDKG